MLRDPGNMYDWITKKRNFIGGECPHQCVYCYVNYFKKRWPKVKEKYSGKPFLIESELEKPEGSGHMVFVQDCGDLFAEDIPSEWIQEVLNHCRKYDNTYLFQSKNPMRFLEFAFPFKVILGTTIESDRNYKLSKAPKVQERAKAMKLLSAKYKRMITIEPIISFIPERFVSLLKVARPNWINIGADSKGHNLPEPSPDKIRKLIEELRKFTEVKVKDNLKRILEKS